MHQCPFQATTSAWRPCSSIVPTFVHRSLQQQQHCCSKRKRRHVASGVDPNVIATVAGDAGQALQDIIVGGAVVGAVGAALYGGLRKDQVVCDLCQGTGGAKCFGCGGEGRMQLKKREDLYNETRARDPFGRSRNPAECRVCRGVGLTLCSKCKGSGYMSVL